MDKNSGWGFDNSSQKRNGFPFFNFYSGCRLQIARFTTESVLLVVVSRRCSRPVPATETILHYAMLCYAMLWSALGVVEPKLGLECYVVTSSFVSLW